MLKVLPSSDIYTHYIVLSSLLVEILVSYFSVKRQQEFCFLKNSPISENSTLWPLHTVHSTLQRQNAENLIQIFPEKEYRGLRPNFHIHVSESELYIPSHDGSAFSAGGNMSTDPGNIKSLTDA
jgi:hypothetical protein